MSFEDIIVLRYAKQTASPPWMNGITYAEIDTVATMTKGNTDIIITGDGSRNKTQVMPGGVSVSKEVKLSDNWNQLVMSVNYPSIDNYVLGVQDHTITPPASVPSALTNGTYRILDASTESIMKNALKKVFLNKFFYERIDTIDGDIIRIDCNGILSRSGFDTHRDFKFGGWYDDYDMYYTMHEQLLLDMCGCFGVDEDDVIMLLDYGYSADEIEAMLMDYDMISETVNAVKNMEEPYTICG